jgi:predicted nucleic acid-binding protein
MWIAAHAQESGAELLSADTHFEAVDGLAWTRLSTAT